MCGSGVLQCQRLRSGGSEIFGGGAGVSDGPAHTECVVRIIFVCICSVIFFVLFLCVQ